MKNWRTKLKFSKYMLLVVGWLLIYKFIDKLVLIDNIKAALPIREAGLMVGMVWGEKKEMEWEFYNFLKNSGLVHVVVVSGANLMIIGRMLIENLAKFLGRKVAIIWGLGIVLIYINAVGFEIPVVRAWLFLGLYYLAQILGKKFKVSRALIMVGLLMILSDYKVIFDISFWLSMMAFLGVVLTKGRSVVVTTIWVSLLILPILSMFFGKISLITPIANMGVLFLVEIITSMGFVGSLLSRISLVVGGVILQMAYPFLRYLVWMAELMGGWEKGVLDFRFNWWMMMGWYLMCGGYWYEKKKI
ncbi:ComEC/Rec2 family competence protein [Candidatus Shapirobacteria bacterium]|nr:ComEC/Rec2 family competence protein [Candidatus Shapirobacteria bacterium]